MQVVETSAGDDRGLREDKVGDEIRASNVKGVPVLNESCEVKDDLFVVFFI